MKPAISTTKRAALPFLGLFLAALMAFASPGMAQSAELGDVASAIKAGNARALATYFDNTVEVTILSQEGSYSKAQAEAVVKDFFSKHKPTAFQIIHKGDSGGNAKYAIGKLGTASGSYRTYIYVKRRGESLLIQQLRFEQE